VTSVTKESGANYVEQCRMLHNNSMLNSILNVPSDVTAAGATLVHIPVRGLTNGLVLTYQDKQLCCVVYALRQSEFGK
jgi:hypothetical protein